VGKVNVLTGYGGNLIVGGAVVESKNACNFDCFYYCYKIGLPSAMTWLE